MKDLKHPHITQRKACVNFSIQILKIKRILLLYLLLLGFVSINVQAQNDGTTQFIDSTIIDVIKPNQSDFSLLYGHDKMHINNLFLSSKGVLLCDQSEYSFYLLNKDNNLIVDTFLFKPFARKHQLKAYNNVSPRTKLEIGLKQINDTSFFVGVVDQQNDIKILCLNINAQQKLVPVLKSFDISRFPIPDQFSNTDPYYIKLFLKYYTVVDNYECYWFSLFSGKSRDTQQVLFVDDGHRVAKVYAQKGGFFNFPAITTDFFHFYVLSSKYNKVSVYDINTLAEQQTVTVTNEVPACSNRFFVDVVSNQSYYYSHANDQYIIYQCLLNPYPVLKPVIKIAPLEGMRLVNIINGKACFSWTHPDGNTYQYALPLVLQKD
nr:hypothetical protein [uncultured Carboxylicivirga sp.]